MDLELTPLERAVLEKLFAGEHPVLAALRTQLEASKVARRELTGVGFFVDFTVPRTVPPAPVGERLSFGDVHAELEGLAHGAGFLAFVEEGYLTLLEGFSYDEPWPASTDRFLLRYEQDPREPAALGSRPEGRPVRPRGSTSAGSRSPAGPRCPGRRR